tara:strand:+ start:18 stop:317 length:300 start_codon:yes stop_codon:yes gene_type:complete
MELGKTAIYYRNNKAARAKHQETSKKWNQSDKGKAYKAEKNATPLEKKKHATRVEARKIMKAKPGQVVDHKKTLAKGGSNSKSNLRIVSAHINNTKNKK